MKAKKIFESNQGQKNTKGLSKFFHFLFAFAVLGGGLFFSGEAMAATYYVDSSITDTYVNNAAPDFSTYNYTTFETTGSNSSVYKTIADLNSKMGSSGFLPGDQILFRRGQTWSESLNIADSGVDGSPITFGSFGSGDNPVINRLYARDYLAGGDWTIFEDLDFSNPSGRGIDWKKYDNVIFRRINVYNSSSNGMDIVPESEDYPSNITIENSNIYNNAGYGIWAHLAETSTIRHVVAYNNGSGGNQNNISASPYNSGSILTIEDTDSYSAYGNGFGSAPNNASATVIFNRCKAYNNNQTGFIVHGTVPATIKIYDCLAYSNGTYGMSVGSLVTNPVNSEIYNCTIENNANVGLFMQSIGSHIVKNNIIYNNGEGVPASGVQVSWLKDGATLISDNNIITEQSQGRTIYTGEIATMKTLLEWQSYSGGQYDQYSAGSNPLFISSSDYALQYLSPAIDSGTSVSLTTDYAGNPIYGTPDIGAYEYQPPYTIGTNEIDTAGDVRIYADGKFRNTATAGGTTADLSITPSGGFGAGDYSEWMNIDIDTWNTTGTYYKKWTETSDNSSLTSAHTVGDLSASTYYTVWYTKSGEDKTRLTTEQADGSSQIAFTYDQGYSDVIFEIEEDDNAPAAFELSSPANNSWTNDNTPTLSWNASSDTESGLAKYQLWINDTLDKDNIDSSATSTTPTSALSDGSYTWYIKAIDNNSNERQSTSTRTINIDTVSSFATFDSSAPANPTNQNTTDVTVAGTDITHYKYKLDDGSYSSETAIAVHLALSDLTDGEHTISLIGKDTAGNWQAEGSATTHTWTVDITSPVISLVSPANNSSTGDNTPTLTWSGSDATSGIAKYQLYVDGSLDTDNISSSATSVTPTDSLSCDSHTWYIRAYDNVDNYTDSSTFNLIISCGSGFISSSPPIISLSPNQTFEIITINNQSIINLSQVENAYQIAISTTPDFEFVSWEPYQENVVLPDAKKVYLKFRSETGGVSEVYEVETRQCLVSTNLLNGSLIRAINNYKVYIINNPSIGSGQAYIRHIIDEIIFTFYGHLNKDNIQEIDPSLMDNYQESYLIREINDYKVYKIINNKKHWLNISVEEFAERGYGWDEVFVVNEEEKDWYEAGEEIRH